MSLEAKHMQTIRHEASHAAAAWIALGPDHVGMVTRKEDAERLGRFDILLVDPPLGMSPERYGYAFATVFLAPLADGCDPGGCSLDTKQVDRVADVALRFLPGTHPDAWRDKAFASARELVKETRYVRLRSAVEKALLSAVSLSAEQVRHVLQVADSSGP